MLPFLKKYWPLVVLFITSVAICITNYTPGTSLSGWDTLHPEFNFGLNFERIINGVFRSEQGLGAVAGHSHMAELPRIILLWITSLVLPVEFLRYFYIFLTLIAGPIGMYLFLGRVVFKNKNQTAAFLGAMFYMLNLGTLQQYVVAFEMFNTLYALLPFLMLFATEYIDTKPKTQKINKKLLLFAITTFLATPMSYAATLWYVYFMLLCAYLFFYILPNLLKRRFMTLKKSVILVLITLSINSFWLLPNLYYVKNHAANVSSSQINTLFSPQAFLYNKEFGTGDNLILMKSFLFDWGIYANYNSFDKLLTEWITHLENPFVLVIGYSAGIISIAGLLFGSIKRQRIALSLVPLILIILFFLINDNFPTSYLFTFLREKVPILQEALRFPHSKFYVHFIFVYAVCFALGQALIIKSFEKFPKRLKIITAIFYPVFFSAALIYFMLPAFQGEFISKYIRVKIPQEYTQMSNWFNRQTDTRRVAPLPIHSFWGWDYHNWYGNTDQSYQGAGFLWFNIKQPFLARDFDRWIPYNEGYYKEMSYAVYSQDPQLVKNVLEKYNIGYILLDKSNIAPSSDPAVLFYDKIEDLLKNKDLLEIDSITTFGPNLFVYHFKQNIDYVYKINNPTVIKPVVKTQTEDIAYQKYSNYISYPKNNSDESVFFPFRNIIDNQNRLNVPFNITQNGISLLMPDSYNGADLDQNNYLSQEELVPANLIVKRENDPINSNNFRLSIRLYPFTPLGESQSIPIEVITTLPRDEASYILSINQSNIILINDLENNVSYSLGRVHLNTNSDNSIGVYKTTIDTNIIPDFSSINFSLRQCSEISENQNFGINFLTDLNGFSLTGKNAPLCMMIPLEEIVADAQTENSDEILLGINFNFEENNIVSDTNNLPVLCLADLSTTSCLNTLVNDASSSTSLTNNFRSNFGIKSDSYKNMGIKIVFDASQSDMNQKISYTNFGVSLTQPLFYRSFSADIIADSLIPGFENEAQIQNILIPFAENSELNKDLTTLPKTTGSCDDSPILESGNNSKQIVKSYSDYIRYSSGQGTLCDHFSYPGLEQSQGHLLMITSRNISGLPISICATNYLSKRCDLYASLTSSKEFETEVFVLPPIADTENGYDININNLGIKNTPSVNDLKAIKIIPFPYKWLTGIESKNTEGKNVLKSDIENVTYETPNSYAYLVSPNGLDRSSTIALSQSFEKGWRAYRISNFKCQISNIKCRLEKLFPSIFGTEIKNHVMVNNWANGWVLDDQELGTENQDQTIAIVYLPQYLQYLGASLVPITFVFILINANMRLRKKKNYE